MVHKLKYTFVLLILNIIFINRKLNIEEAQEIKNISHHISLFSFSLGEIIFSDRKKERNSIEEYVITPAKERGIFN